jgi:thiol-disulfide isomerase/thioredoxin
MGKLQIISSQGELDNLLKLNEFVAVKFTAAWCGPCKAIAPLVEKFHDQFSTVAFAEVDVDTSKAVAQKYSITAMPTFVYFHKSIEVERIRGADPEAIYKALEMLAAKNPSAIRVQNGNGAESSSSPPPPSSSSSSSSGLPNDVQRIISKTKFEVLNDIVHIGGAELLNVSSHDSSGDLRKLLDLSNPGKGVASEADSQILIYLPLQNKAKVHSIFIKAAVVEDGSGEETQIPSTIKVWANNPTTISFDDASSGGIKPLHSGPVPEPDENGWREINLRFVHFQNVTSIQIFLDGDDEETTTVVQQLLLVGSKGGTLEQGKLEKLEN